jgi:hypothetical protein
MILTMFDRLLQPACPVAAMLTLAILTPASACAADFFDNARRTFQTDIPHFFQDDIPCAFGGQPTSHTKSSCKSSDPKPAQNKTSDRGTVKPGPH